MQTRSRFALLMLSIASSPAWAGNTPVPEPGVLELLAIGAMVGVAIALRRRRNK